MRAAVVNWRAASVALALRPLRCVFSGAEVALLLLLALLLDEWAAHARDRADELQTRARNAHERKARRIANATTRAEVKAALRKMTTTRTDAIGGAKAAVNVTLAAAARDASAHDGTCCSWELTDSESTTSCSTSDTALLSATSSCSHRSKREQTSEREAALFSSMAISRFSDEIVHDVAFLHKSGELQMRRDSVLHVFKPWRKCSILLSVTSGELFVHRKAKAPPEVFPLSRFTGASISSSRRHTFKVVFDGHAPLLFRATKTEDAERWVKALEYAKEATWRMWS